MAIIGICINVKDDDSDIGKIADSVSNIGDLLREERFFAGKYVLFLRTKEDKYYAVGDKTSSIQINYCLGNKAIASVAALIAHEGEKPVDAKKIKIKKSHEAEQSMPNDITIYQDIYALLPNHYLDINEGKAVRFSASHHGRNKNVEGVEYTGAISITCPVPGNHYSVL